MSVRSRAAVLDAPVAVSKVFGPNVPAATVAAEARSQMTPASPFSPGEPIGPYDGFSRTPRTQDYVTGYNIATRPRTHERVSFDALKGLIGAYDVAQIAIWHRIDSLRGIKWKLLAADHYNGDVSGAVPLGVAALRKPDRINGFRTWFAKWMWDVFAYDAGALYRLRNRGGKCIGLLPVDGTMIAPLLDYWGNPPGAMAVPGEDLPPAYVQYVNGLPWNWLTRADLVYEPFRPHNDSPYGHAPIESIMLNSNTDIRFQLHFLQRYTDGNIPAAFASAPDTWTPDQIEAWQELWDSFMYGDQARKNQIRWMPGGSKIMWSNEKDFTDAFSLFMMRKSCAAFHVVPTDLGFTETSNYSSGESQGDVQHRVGELPSMEYAEEILSRFVYDDLQLPLKFEFDRGEDQDDRVAQAQADEIYWKIGAAGSSEIREWRYGRSDPVPVPRSIFTERAGPIPIASLLAVAGQVDPETALPAAGAPLPEEVFGGTEGVLPNPPIKVMSLAEREFGESAMPPAPPPQPVLQPGQVGQSQPAPVAKEGEGTPSAGITSETGLYSYDLAGRDDEDDGQYGSADEEERELAEGRSRETQVAKELAAFRNFRRKRRAEGEWRDFGFRSVPPVRAHNLNDAGRLAVRKDAGEVAVAGLAVLAADTGRVLMIQRALSDDDPAAGTWEFPGGHVEGDEVPLAAAAREWCEETGCILPFAPETMAALAFGNGSSWTNGIYQGFVYPVPSEDCVKVRSEVQVINPDDPDGDQSEAVAWWNPADLPGLSSLRPELAASLGDVLPLLSCPPPDSGEAAEPVEKAGKQGSPKQPDWPGWKLDLATASYWSPKVTAAARQALSRQHLDAIASAYVADHPGQDGQATGKLDRKAAAVAWLRSAGVTVPMDSVAPGIAADSVLIGGASAEAAANGNDTADTGDWQPGDTEAAGALAAGLGLAALHAAVTGSGGADGGEYPDVAGGMEDGYLGVTAGVLAGWDEDTSADELSGALGDAVADPDYAARLTAGQIEILVGSAALRWYLANGVALLQWYSGPGACVICLGNAAAPPRAPGVLWPGGVAEPLQHPNCGCYLAPP